jgi:hypothetical protein
LFFLFLLAIVLSVLLSFGHCVVCPSVFWPLCCLSFDKRLLIIPFDILKLFLNIVVRFLPCPLCLAEEQQYHFLNKVFGCFPTDISRFR